MKLRKTREILGLNDATLMRRMLENGSLNTEEVAKILAALVEDLSDAESSTAATFQDFEPWAVDPNKPQLRDMRSTLMWLASSSPEELLGEVERAKKNNWPPEYVTRPPVVWQHGTQDTVTTQLWTNGYRPHGNAVVSKDEVRVMWVRTAAPR